MNKKKPNNPQPKRKERKKEDRKKSREEYLVDLRFQSLLEKINNALENAENLSKEQVQVLEEQKKKLLEYNKAYRILNAAFQKEKKEVERLENIDLIPGSNQNPALLLAHFGIKAAASLKKLDLKKSEILLEKEIVKIKKGVAEANKAVKEALSNPIKKNQQTFHDLSKEDQQALLQISYDWEKAMEDALDSEGINEEQKLAAKMTLIELRRVRSEIEKGNKISEKEYAAMAERLKSVNVHLPDASEISLSDADRKSILEASGKLENELQLPIAKKELKEIQKTIAEESKNADKIIEYLSSSAQDDDDKLLELLKKLEDVKITNKEHQKVLQDGLKDLESKLSEPLKKIESNTKDQLELEKDKEYEKKDEKDNVKISQKIEPAPVPVSAPSPTEPPPIGRGGTRIPPPLPIPLKRSPKAPMPPIPPVPPAGGAKIPGRVPVPPVGEAEKVVERGGGLLGKLPKFGPKAAKAAGWLAKKSPYIGPIVYTGGQVIEGIANKRSAGNIVARASGGLAGGILGAKVGAALGSLVGPGPGTVAGGLIGGILGTLLGEETGKRIGEALKNLFFKKIDEYDLTETERAIKLQREKIQPRPARTPAQRPLELAAPKQSQEETSVSVKKEEQLPVGEAVEGSQLKEMQDILGEKLAIEAAKVAITEGGYDKKTKKLKTTSINKESQAAGMYQFLPSTALDLAAKIEDPEIKKKFQPFLDEKQKTGKINREGVAKVVSELSTKEQTMLYKKYLEPLLKREGGAENITAAKLKAYGFAPVSQLGSKSDETVIYKEGGKAYEQNRFLDPDQSGDITKKEIEDTSEKIIKKGESSFEDFIAANRRPLPRQREETVVVAKAEAPKVTPTTTSLMKESQTKAEKQASVVQVAYNNTYNTNNMNKDKGIDNTSRASAMPTRNPDPIYQKSLEKLYYG